MEKCIMYQGKPLIWPLPNRCRWMNGFFSVQGTLTLSTPSCFEDDAGIFTMQLLQTGISCEVVGGSGDIRLLQSHSSEINNEGYLLDVAAEGITLQAKTGRGIFYGFQSLVQLILNSAGRLIPCVSVADSPFKPIRAVHLYTPSRANLEWFKRYVDFLAKYKYNTMFIEVSAAMKYDSHPEINEAWVEFCSAVNSMPHGSEAGVQRAVGHFKNSVHPTNGGGGYLEKAEFSELLAYIKAKHIKVIPELQGLSHCYWMLMAHKECAERQDDPWPDTWCPSNPKSYEIYLDCLQEILDVFKPEIVHIGHDEYYSIGICERCRDRAGQDILAEDIIKIHDWLAARGVKTAMWSDKLFAYTALDGKLEGGVKRLQFNNRTGKNELMPPTARAVDRIPNDILMLDWHHSLSGEGVEDVEDTASQDHFYRRGMEVVFGNFYGKLDHLGTKNVDDRLRRPNVLGAMCSHWREASDMGLALFDQMVRCLEIANVLWHEGYTLKTGYLWNNLIAQIYPIERDILNNSPSARWDASGFTAIALSGFCNATLSRFGIDEAVIAANKLPHTVPFELLQGDACVLAGHGEPDVVEGITVGGRYRSIAFLHSYTVSNPVPHTGFDDDPARDVVGRYIIEYVDGGTAAVPIEYGRTITGPCSLFGAYWSNPVYLELIVKDTIKELPTSKLATVKTSAKVVFSYEWKNPYPDKEIKSISLEHYPHAKGGVALFGITAIP